MRSSGWNSPSPDRRIIIYEAFISRFCRSLKEVFTTINAFNLKLLSGFNVIRYIRAVHFNGMWTNEIRPPMMAAVIIDVIGRGERIRTSDLSVPNRAHYQAVLRPEG